ncbi:alcohol dehydrogenase catalytic domain-containing protein [Rhodococcus sp. WB9]|uniref:alcohol dehydrogenase catalytic domain-containing protein n=1 Tax=Rhodococcus sp. WB9 TaxID=2594007 RepID=UPI0021B3FDF2|nr:alcohol dehydrogenase catalytic domain-containing protein [Rhodococcus sp. WB9]
MVRVHAAGVNVLDWLLGEGGFEHFPDVPLPWIPGWDVSGVVEVVGDGVSGFQQGDSVYGMVQLPEPGNAYAEYGQFPPVRSSPSRPSWTTYKRRRCR